MTEYEQRTLGWIRLVSPRLARLPDEALCTLYRQWSEMWHAAGWLMEHPDHIKDFCQWATSAPCEVHEVELLLAARNGRPE